MLETVAGDDFKFFYSPMVPRDGYRISAGPGAQLQ
jgi:hypothetical protein